MEILISLIAGALISWVISHYYYKKSSKEIPAWANELPDWAKPIIEKLPYLKPTSDELLKLFQELLNDGVIEPDPIFGNIACPKCNAPLKDLEEKMYGDDNVTIIVKSCPHCGWSEKREV